MSPGLAEGQAPRMAICPVVVTIRVCSQQGPAVPCAGLELICTLFISKAQKCEIQNLCHPSSLVVLFDKQSHKMPPKANRIKLKERVQ